MSFFPTTLLIIVKQVCEIVFLSLLPHLSAILYSPFRLLPLLTDPLQWWAHTYYIIYKYLYSGILAFLWVLPYALSPYPGILCSVLQDLTRQNLESFFFRYSYLIASGLPTDDFDVILGMESKYGYIQVATFDLLATTNRVSSLRRSSKWMRKGSYLRYSSRSKTSLIWGLTDQRVLSEKGERTSSARNNRPIYELKVPGWLVWFTFTKSRRWPT